MLNNIPHSNLNTQYDVIKPMRVIRLQEVKERTGFGRSSIYCFMNEGTFPKSIPLGGRTVGWLESEVAAWITNKIEERDTSSL